MIRFYGRGTLFLFETRNNSKKSKECIDLENEDNICLIDKIISPCIFELLRVCTIPKSSGRWLQYLRRN